MTECGGLGCCERGTRRWQHASGERRRLSWFHAPGLRLDKRSVAFPHRAAATRAVRIVGLDHGDPGEVDLSLFGEDHWQRGENALSHLGFIQYQLNLSVGWIRIQALNGSWEESECSRRPRRVRPTTSAPPAPAAPARKVRRDSPGLLLANGGLGLVLTRASPPQRDEWRSVCESRWRSGKHCRPWLYRYRRRWDEVSEPAAQQRT